MLNCYLFAGPSLTQPARARARALGLTTLPPVVRDDVASVITERKPGTLIIADGRFDQTMAVGHAELRQALERGWQLWGLASMGAIRAYELRFLGMRGWGKVYDLFERCDDFQDDEVALLHEPEAPYRPASEPLVHLRVAAQHLTRRRLVTRAASARVIGALKRLWYGDRTLALFQDLMLDSAVRGRRGAVQGALADFDRFRIKQKDLAAFLAARSLWCVHGMSPA